MFIGRLRDGRVGLPAMDVGGTFGKLLGIEMGVVNVRMRGRNLHKYEREYGVGHENNVFATCSNLRKRHRHREYSYLQQEAATSIDQRAPTRQPEPARGARRHR